ncbi:hypothetical protein [Streptomyces sp. CB02261]|uniref:hypothetical protein n=1 Tax=Streptomyces sp. CB02261 TaxID=1703940 RepID=UPI00093A943F|nr:hypothetical protein [Streptomyces sp. CB02261]OKJ57443.1 hypothetical protein AMK29_27320 [Streptomyces sp. CB02261]
MKFRALLRSSSALWTAPVWGGIVAFYFFYALHFEDPYEEVIGGPLWAAEQVSSALNYFYAFAYAITLGLATWEGGRLKRDRVWDLAPSRARWRVVGQALAPAVGAGWAILLLPVTMRLIETRLLPTTTAVLPLAMGMGIVCAYAVVGCVLGHVAPRAIAAPVGAVATFYVISKSSTYSDPLWPRHLSGQLSTSVAFGEYYSPATVLLPLLVAAAVAAAVAAWWSRGPRRVPLRLLATAAALATLVLSARTASGWGVADGPVTAGHAPARCAGTAPRVCMAEAGGAVERLDDVRAEVTGSLEKLRAVGVDVTVPSTVTDGLLYERGSTRPRSTAATWWLPLTAQAEAAGPGSGIVGVRYAVMLSSVTFPCSIPTSFDPGTSNAWVVNRDAAVLWAAHAVDAQDPYLRWRAGQYAQIANGPEVLAKVQERAANGLALPTAAQRTAWFEQEKAKACRLVPKRAGSGPAASGSQGADS